jgi:hypothetical protein
MVSCTNMFPCRGGVSNNLSPHTLICGVSFEYKTQCRVPFGTYCEIHDENVPTNIMQARTTPAISLGPTGNLQGTYKFYSLTTTKLIVHCNWTKLPMLESVITQVKSIAQSQLNIPDISKFEIEFFDWNKCPYF